MKLKSILPVAVLALAVGCAPHKSPKQEMTEQWNRTRANVMAGLAKDQYATGNFSQAQQSLKLALTKDKDDLLARLYLGLTLLRNGHESRGQTELLNARQSVHDWIKKFDQPFGGSLLGSQ